MRVADDRRGRVPFALIGVLLVLGAVGAATVDLSGGNVDHDVRLAGDRAEAAAESALRDAVRDAGATAAARPVATPANTSAGRLLDEEQPFRSYYALLVALELRDRAGATEQRVDGTTARLHLPEAGNRSELAEALRATTVERAGEGLVRVTVEDVAIVVERGGRVVDRRHRTLNVTVATPALELHDRTDAFEERLDGGLATQGSLTRGLTGGLYALGWARGWAQYAGLPISDPIANRHAELVANLAVIDAQRSTFGTADRAAEEGLARATLRVAADESVGIQSGGLADAALPEPDDGRSAPGEVAPPEADSIVVGVNRTADRALADVLREDPLGVDAGDAADQSLDAIVREAATVDARVETATATRQRLPRDHVAPENASEWRERRGAPVRSVETVSAIDDGPRPAAAADWELRDPTFRRVEVVERVPVTYVHRETGAELRREQVYDVTVDVGVAVAVRPRSLPTGPERDVRPPADERTERLERRAERQLLDDVDELARDAALGAASDRTVSVRPSELAEERDHVYEELAELREELRTIRTETERSALATSADPAAELRDRLAARRSAHVDAPGQYADLGERAAVAARAVYVDRTADRLAQRSAVQSSTQDALRGAADDAGGLAEAGLEELLSVGTEYARPDAAPTNGTPPAPDLELSVDGGPSYLERDAVEVAGEEHYPLGVRTRTLPSLDAEAVANGVGDRIAAELFDVEETVPLSVAAHTVRRTEDVPEAVAAETGLAAERRQLERAVADRVERLEYQSAHVVASETGLDEAAARTAVTDATARWATPAERALAFDEGAAADAVAATVADRRGLSDREADELAVLLDDRVARLLAAETTHVEADGVDRVAEAARDVAADVASDATEAGIEAASDRIEDRVGDLPTVGLRGVPVVPVPGYWVANANAWHVDVAGGYAHFAVSAPVGGPAGGATVRYVRDGRTVRHDVTGDGSAERLGRASRVTFEGSTTVLVVVPPGTGVGNADPSFAEASPGWEQWAEDGHGEAGGEKGTSSGPS